MAILNRKPRTSLLFLSAAKHQMRRAAVRAYRAAGVQFEQLAVKGEGVARTRPVSNLGSQRPVLAIDVFVAPNATVIGDVLCYDRSSIWYGAVVRGDKNKVRIGRVTNIMDRAVLNTVETPAVETGFPSDLNIGSYVTVGQGSILTSCSIGAFLPRLKT